MVTLNDSTLLGLARRDDLVAAFPELARLRTAVDQRSCCGATNVTRELLLEVRASLAQLSADRQTQLKRLLGADMVTVRYKVGSEFREARF